MDVLSEGLTALAEVMSETAATPIIYRLISGESATLNATLGQSSREQAIEEGLISVVRRLDMLVSAAEFTAAFGASAKPREGDTAEIHGIDWQCRPFGGEPGARYADPHRTRHRIHLIEL